MVIQGDLSCKQDLKIDTTQLEPRASPLMAVLCGLNVWTLSHGTYPFGIWGYYTLLAQQASEVFEKIYLGKVLQEI